MNIENIGPGGGPQEIPNQREDNEKTSSKETRKAASFWKKFVSSSGTGSSVGKTHKIETKRKVSSGDRSKKLSNLEEKSSQLGESAKSFSDTASRLREKYEKESGKSFFSSSFLKKNLFGRRGFYEVNPKKDPSEGLRAKASSLKESSASFEDSARKLADKYERRAKASVSRKLSSLTKEEKSSSKSGLKAKTSSLKESSQAFEENAKKLAEKESSQSVRESIESFFSSIKKTFVSGNDENGNETLEVLEEVEETIAREAEDVESVNSCLDDCCDCFAPLRRLFKKIPKETQAKESAKNSCCKELKQSLRELKEKIGKSIEDLREGFRRKIRNTTVGFRQKLHEKALAQLLNSSNLENKSKVLLSSIFLLAEITGFSCQVKNSHLVFTPISEKLLFSERVATFNSFVESTLESLEVIPLSESEIVEVERELKNIMQKLANYSNYLKYLLGIFK